MTERFIYESPIGALKISADTDAVNELVFVKETTTTSTGNEINEAPENPVLLQCIYELDNYFSGKNFVFTINLRQHGTAFQQSVWDALLKIKPGTVTSYLQLSKSLGNPKAIRAVGTANGKNNIAIIVPCHRVIGSNGSLVGYGGELWRKKWLLQHEAKFIGGAQTLF